jgi:hypothetical protein
VVGTPIFIGVTDEVGVEVARIGGDFASKPRRCLDGFGFGGDFHLSDDEPFVVAVEDIDFPGPAAESFAISGLAGRRSARDRTAIASVHARSRRREGE